MSIDIKNLKEILLKGNYITEDDAKRGEDHMKSHGGTLTDYFLDQGLINKDLLGQAIAESLAVPFCNLRLAAISPAQVNQIPENPAKTFHAVVFSSNPASVTIATDDPMNKDLVPEMKKIFKGKDIKVAYSMTEDINALFVHYQKSLETRFSKIIEKQTRIAPEILEEIFDDALVFKASDIHFEPQLKDVVIRFRVDGVLQEAGRIPKTYYENILNRVKVKSGLRIDEHFATQDGSLRYEKEGKFVDMRTSIAPTVEGEKIVLRVLSSYIEGLTLSNLGLSVPHQELIQAAANKPFGMILVVGPTGSGIRKDDNALCAREAFE
jgi:type IV pilus assembly protein PilB